MKPKSAIFIRVALAAAFAMSPIVVANAMSQGSDISGTWKAKTVSARGSAEQTITFKQSGSTFTGEMVNSAGVKEAITDGKITGADIEFTVERKQASGDVSKVPYKGKVNGNEITGTFTGASGASVNWTATKDSGGMSGM